MQAPWVDYNARRGTGQYPWFPWFKEYFRMDTLAQYHDGRVIDMADFLHHFRGKWEEAGVVGYCGYRKDGDKSDGCMKFSVPKGPYWTNLNVSFDPSAIQVVNRRDLHQIREIDHPVLCLDCAPGRYPADRALDPLSQYLQWSDTITAPAYEFIEKNLPRPFIALHFRHAFAQAGCGFSVGQCTDFGDKLDESRVCTPGVEDMRWHLQGVMDSFGPPTSFGPVVKALFVASDRAFGEDVMAMFHSMVGKQVVFLPTGLNEVEGGSVPGSGGSPQIDLAVLTLADHAVLHCPSSFSNVAKRLRDHPNTYTSPSGVEEGPFSSTSFWGVDSSLPIPKVGDGSTKEF